MKAEIKGGPAFAYIDMLLAPGETLVTEPDAMSSMDPQLDLRAGFNGGFLRGLAKKLLAGDSLLISRFTNSTEQARRLVLAQPRPGELRCLALDKQVFYLQPGAYLASTEGVELGLRWAGLASFFAREGLFKLAVSGTGQVWYGAYGALLEKEIDGEYIVDTSHLVAYEPGIRLSVRLAGGIFSSIFGGEGLVTRVRGRGKIVIQSRSLSGLAAWLNPKFK